MRRCLPAIILAGMLGIGACPAQPLLPAQPPSSAQALLPGGVSFGLDAGPALALHRASFTALPGVPNCCPTFTGDAGFAFTAGIFAAAPLSARFSGQLGLRLLTAGGTLTETEATTFLVAGTSVPGSFEHAIRTRLLYVAIEPGLRARVYDGLLLHAGVRVGIPLRAAFEQWEHIVEPADRGVFTETGTRARNAYSGDIPGAGPPAVSLLAGVSFPIALDREATLEAEPGLTYSQALTRVTPDVAWTLSTATAAIGLRYYPWRGTPDTVPAAPPPPPPPRIPALLAEVKAFGIDTSGNDLETPSIRVEEFIGSQLRPLLPFVFFDEGSAAIPPRYRPLTRGEAAAFRPEQLATRGTIESYREILNIVGRRMQESPGATVTLVGCNADAGVERRSTELSRRRADAVRAYLVSAWDVAASRITVKVRNLPVMNSAVAEPDGIAENRRVEIESGPAELLQPVSAADTVRLVTRPRIRFRPNVAAEAGVDAWTLEILHRDRMLHAFEGRGSIPAMLEWDATASRVPLPDTLPSLSFALTVRDSSGRSIRTAEQDIRIERFTVQRKREERIADRIIDRYALILFDFNQSGIRPFNRPVIDLIRAGIRPQSAVRITGYTDRIGDAQGNRELSAARAVEVKRALGVEAATEGVGEDIMLYDNATPEGRMYCRTVVVRVDTPVEYDAGE